MPLVNCKKCGNEFNVSPSVVRIGKGKYCSKQCFDLAQTGIILKHKWRGIYKNCHKCGKEFYLRPSQASCGKFCSRNCTKSSVVITCKICGSKKPVRLYKIKEGKGIFCSIDCYNIHKKSSDHKTKIRNWWLAAKIKNTGRKDTREQLEKKSIVAKQSWKDGRNRGFSGRHHSDEEKQHRRLLRLGKPNLSTRGEKNYRWKGGITPENHKIRTSLEYRNWRNSVFKRDNWVCQMCGSRVGNKQADHIKPFSLFPELRFELSNGRTLCEPCHKKTFSHMNRNLTMETWMEHERNTL